MIENYPTPIKTAPRGALQIELQARETARQMANLAANYKINQTVSVPVRSANPIKKLLAALFSGLKTQDRGYSGATRVPLANSARK